MKTARLIARFLEAKATALRRRAYVDFLVALAVGVAILVFQFLVFLLLFLGVALFAGSLAVECAAGMALLVIVGQFAIYLVDGNRYRKTVAPWRRDAEMDPEDRLIVGGFLLAGAQTFVEAVCEFRQARRLRALDFDNCARVLAVLMKEQDAISMQQTWDAVAVGQSVHAVVEQLRLFPGVIVQPTHLQLTAKLRIEIADFCRREKGRIREAALADDGPEW